MSEAIENLADLIHDEGDGQTFFARNYVTQGMSQLFREGMLRLSGKSDQAVFELTQAMGGGKTHMMIALGLLARHSELRPKILPQDLAEQIDFPSARIAAFNGRNNPENFIWGEIATQLGQDEAIRDHWVNGPKAVDQRKWKELIGDTPTLILLDELPPYLQNAATQVSGSGTLADMVVYSLSTLMSAALELPNCCIVIANLSGSYGQQSKQLRDAISNLQQEARRQAMTITPVDLAGNEIYDILKKRLIDELPDENTISDIAEEYAAEVKKAEDGGYIIAASIEQLAEQVRQTYPFHPSFKHLVALFKENEGFRQTRGLMQFTARLLKSVADRESDDVYLIGAQHLNLNDPLVKNEIERIAPALKPAVARDIADGGEALAEQIDAELGEDAAQQVMTLLLASSLSRAVNGRIGLTESEIAEFLVSPQRKVDTFLNTLQQLRERAWYLHREEQRLFIKDTENLSRRVEREAKQVPQPRIDSALTNHLEGILQPQRKNLYQDVQILPKLDDLKLSGNRALIVVRPDGRIPPNALKNFFDYQTYKNNLLVLSGQDSHLTDAVEDRLRELYAIEQIFSRMRSGDSLYEEARDRKEEALKSFQQSLSAAYNTIFFPASDPVDQRGTLAKLTIDNGLNIGSGDQSAEAQLERLLASAKGDNKLALDMSESWEDYFAQAEAFLWPSGRDNRRTPWRDVLAQAKSNPEWPWMPGASGMETLKTEALKQGRWRLGSDGYIEKGPFPKEKTDANIVVASTDPKDGTSILTITPRNAGDNPQIHVDTKASVSSESPRVEDPESYKTDAATLYFLVIDTNGKYETGKPVPWVASLKIRHQLVPAGTTRKLELECTPRADMRYTLDGTNPHDGKLYEGPIEIDAKEALLQVYAEAGEATERATFQIPASNSRGVQIDDAKPAQLLRKVPLDGTERTFAIINAFDGKGNVRLKGVRVEIGEAENTVTVRFGDREIGVSILSGTINSLRELLGDPQALVSVSISDGVSFGTGFDLKEFAKLAGVELKPGDVVQGGEG